jgi:hypothetical protein
VVFGEQERTCIVSTRSNGETYRTQRASYIHEEAGES